MAAPCEFRLGFKALRDAIPTKIGDCLEDEWHDPANGDGRQRSTGGELVWRKADNHVAFTDGHRTWVNGPNGIQNRLNSERFAWESQQPAAAAPPPAPARPSAVGVDPRTVSLTERDLTAGFSVDADPDLTFFLEREDGSLVSQTAFTRRRTQENIGNGPVDVRVAVVRNGSVDRAAELVIATRDRLLAAPTDWAEAPIEPLGDLSVGLIAHGEAAGRSLAAYLVLFARGPMVAGVRVAGAESVTRMANAEALASLLLTRIDDPRARLAPDRQSERSETRATPTPTPRPARPATPTPVPSRVRDPGPPPLPAICRTELPGMIVCFPPPR